MAARYHLDKPELSCSKAHGTPEGRWVCQECARAWAEALPAEAAARSLCGRTA